MPKSKKQLVSMLIEEGIFFDPEFINMLPDDLDFEQMSACIRQASRNEMTVLCKESLELLRKGMTDIDWRELERHKAISEKNGTPGNYHKFLDKVDGNHKLDPFAGGHDRDDASAQSLDKQQVGQLVQEASKAATATAADKSNSLDKNKPGVKVIFSYNKSSEKRSIQDFVKYFNRRFKALEAILSNRQDLSTLTSINRVLAKSDRENVSVIGLIKEKNIFSNGNIMIVLEDPTGEIKVLAKKERHDIYSIMKNLVVDEVIGVSGMNGDKIIFPNAIVFPDVPQYRELKKSPDEAYAIFLSDIHVGSTNFLRDEFMRFISWLNGEIGTDAHKEIVGKIRYVFIAGDLVDGVGIYPAQEKELVIRDIYEQMDECARLLCLFPKHMQIIICPGNHEPSRLSEPQPPISKEFARLFYEMPNVTMISNPGIVNVHASDDFPGFDVLMYHGYSFDYFISEVDEIRSNGGYDRADLMMKFLLQRRHLAPSHSSTLYIPDTEFDPLVISKIPDFFITGHIHKTAVSSYRNISLICGSCWQSKTSFQEKVGHNPEPARVPLVNLQTRDTKILRF